MVMPELFIELRGELVAAQPVAQSCGQFSNAHGYTERITR